jgi:hypothetical protein
MYSMHDWSRTYDMSEDSRFIYGQAMHYTVYLIRLNSLIMRIEIWNRSAPKRYVDNKLCTELIILKS